MPYTPRLRFEQQVAGTNLSTWGDPHLNNVIGRVDFAIAAWTEIALTADYTLTSSYSDDEARSAMLKFTGAGPWTVTTPVVSKTYVVYNACTDDLIVTTGAGDTATLQAGELCALACDGSNWAKVKVTNYGGARISGVADPSLAQDVATRAYVDAQAFSAAAGNMPGQGGNAGKFLTTDGSAISWAVPDVSQIAGAAPLVAPTFTSGTTTAGGAAVAGGLTVTGGATVTGSSKSNTQALAALDFDLSAADFFTKAISANSAFTFSNATVSKAQAFAVELTISSAAVPSWPASVKWGGGVNPSSALGNGKHVLGFITMDGGTTWTGFVGATAVA